MHPVELHVIGCSHRTAPLEFREKLALTPGTLDRLYAELRALPGVSEALILSTCNRLELYAVLSAEVGAPPSRSLAHLVAHFFNMPADVLGPNTFALKDTEAVAHLFGVAAGLDSQLVGETEILGQVKEAYAHAQETGAAGPALNRVLQKCLQAAKWARTHTGVGRGQVSIGNVAAELAGRIFGDLSTCRVLVVGAGEVGEKTLQAMKSRGAENITVTTRTLEKAEALARAVDGSALEFARFPRHLRDFDIVVSSTAAPEPVIQAAAVSGAMHDRPAQPLFLVDLAVPRDVEPGVDGLPNVFVYDLADLAKIANENLRAREAEVARCKAELCEKATRAWEGIQRRPSASEARAACRCSS